jgi:hypothetical protein
MTTSDSSQEQRELRDALRHASRVCPTLATPNCGGPSVRADGEGAGTPTPYRELLGYFVQNGVAKANDDGSVIINASIYLTPETSADHVEAIRRDWNVPNMTTTLTIASRQEEATFTISVLNTAQYQAQMGTCDCALAAVTYGFFDVRSRTLFLNREGFGYSDTQDAASHEFSHPFLGRGHHSNASNSIHSYSSNRRVTPSDAREIWQNLRDSR